MDPSVRLEDPNATHHVDDLYTSPHRSSAVGNSRKRKIPLADLNGRADFPRKRSVTACQLCRTRKTKCDNDRPICSKCTELNAQCVYEEDEVSTANTAPANQILKRLEYLISLVEPSLRTPGGSHNINSIINENVLASHASMSQDLSGQQPNALTIDPRTDVTPDDNEIAISRYAYFGSGQDILDWPVFEGRYDRRWIEALIFDPTLPCDDLSGPCKSPKVTDDTMRNTYKDPRRASGVGIGVREDDVPHLVETFLLNVHVKNPIFDPDYLRGMARSVAEHGFDWQASSCLVLLVCALASISARFRRQTTWMPAHDLLRADTSLSSTPGYQTAESYYTAASKRIGLLKNTLIATECHFIAGVYEMYSLRPLQAAISFNRACVAFQTLTWMRSEYYATEDQLGKARASRLYWSCLKSEHETSIEIRFPSSGLTKLNYTSHFPAPPLAAASAPEDFYRVHSDFSDATSPARIRNEFEEGWYYYLADIAARRILQRVISSLYNAGEFAWIDTSLPSLLQTAQELDRQLTEWRRTLPELITFEGESPADSELAYHLQARSLETRERIYRPFLYRHIHKRQDSTEQLALSPLVQLHAATCTKLIQHWDVRHRHHGTWFMVRQSFTAALLLLAAQRSGVLMDGETCEPSVQRTLSTLRFWEAEAPDLKASRLILEDLSSQPCVRIET